jgi:YbbR domain-containing protein
MAETTWAEKINMAVWILLDGLRRFFLENTLLKVISLIIAVFMWYSLSTQEERSRTLENVPLTVGGHRADTVVMEPPLKVVDLRLRGPRGTIMDLEPDDVSVTVDTSALPPGNHTVWLTPQHVRAPENVEVLRIDPPNLLLIVESKISRRVDVEPTIDPASIPAGFSVIRQEVTPAQVAVTGPASSVRAIERVPTALVRLSGDGPVLTGTAKVRLNQSAIAVEPDTVNVSLTLDELEEKVLSGVRLVYPPDAARVLVKEVSVTFRGPKSLLDQLNIGDLEARLKTEGLPRGEHVVAPTIFVADAFRGRVWLVAVEPDKITAQIK